MGIFSYRPTPKQLVTMSCVYVTGVTVLALYIRRNFTNREPPEASNDDAKPRIRKEVAR